MSADAATRPSKLNRKSVERPWGGEVWFTAPDPLPLLIKFIYTHDPLSFQVHPGDDYAREHHESLGKTEMWHIVRADANARIALGWREPIDQTRLRAAAESGEIESLVNWVTPHAGDTFFTPAGTVHAIGAGIELWEIQENSDITYRLFDYGRGRELHLDHALNVTNCDASDSAPVALPVCSQWFCTNKIMFDGSYEFVPDNGKWQILIFMEGRGEIGSQSFEQGEVWFVPAGSNRFEIRGDGRVAVLKTWAP